MCCKRRACDLRDSRQLVVAELADALGLHAAGAQPAVRRVRRVPLAVHVLADAAVVAGHRGARVEQWVQALVAAGERAAVAAHWAGRGRDVQRCKHRRGMTV